MIAFVKGKLFSKNAGEAIIDCHGIGYAVSVSLKTFDRLPEIGEEVFLYTHFAVREDAQQLFGFADTKELDLFRLLISVSGVGPRSAVGILSSITADEFSNYIASNDLVHLTKLPGIGKKTAERLVLELKDKIKKLTLAGEANITTTETIEKNSMFEEAAIALISLGYTKVTAEKAVKLSKPDFLASDTRSIETLIKMALKHAMK